MVAVSSESRTRDRVHIALGPAFPGIAAKTLAVVSLPHPPPDRKNVSDRGRQIAEAPLEQPRARREPRLQTPDLAQLSHDLAEL